MFDLNNMRPTTLDNLTAWRVYILKETLETVDGRTLTAGAEITFEYAKFNANTGDATVFFHDAQGVEWAFATHQKRLAACFEKTEYESRPVRAPEPLVALPPLPPDPARWPAWLESQPDFEDAGRLLLGLRQGDARDDADTLRFAALRLQKTHLEVARWLAERSLNLYYSWTSQATSGGEGAAMQGQIRGDLEQLEQILGTSRGNASSR